MKTDQTRRQILKCLAALPVVGPMLPEVATASSAAGAAAAPVVDPLICIGYTATPTAVQQAATPWSTWGVNSTYCFEGLSDRCIERANELKAEGWEIDFIFEKKSVVDDRVQKIRDAVAKMKFRPPLLPQSQDEFTISYAEAEQKMWSIPDSLTPPV